MEDIKRISENEIVITITEIKEEKIDLQAWRYGLVIGRKQEAELKAENDALEAKISQCERLDIIK